MQPLKCHYKVFIIAIFFDFVLLQSTGLYMKTKVGYGGCGFILPYLYLNDSLEYNLILGQEKASLNPDQYNPLADLCLMKAKLFLNKCV